MNKINSSSRLADHHPRPSRYTFLIMWSVVALAIGVVRVTIAHSESFTVAPSQQQQQQQQQQHLHHQHRSTDSSGVSSISSSNTIPFLPPLQLPPSSHIQFHDEATFDFDDRVKRYCAQPPFQAKMEGEPPLWTPKNNPSLSSLSSSSNMSASLKLVQAIVLIRHGDRSAIHHLPSHSTLAGPSAKWTCGKPDAKDTAWANRVVKPFTSTSECIIETDGDACEHLEALAQKESAEISAPAPADGDIARHMLGITKEVNTECSSTKGGELTTLGWEQHRAIGATLGAYGRVDAFRDLLFRKDEERISGSGSIWKRKAIVASTTDYGRTALSLQAFVMGLLKGPVTNDDIKEKKENEENDKSQIDIAPLPGLGPLPLPLHIVQRALDHSLWTKGPPAGKCPRSEKYVLLDKELLGIMARMPSDVSSSISDITKVGESELPGDEETADAMLCRICHDISLPCWKDKEKEQEEGFGRNSGDSSSSSSIDKDAEVVMAAAAGRCLSQSQASRIVMRADAIYSIRSASRATKLNTYPILSDLVKTLTMAAEKRENSPRFVVRAGHDTVVAPILASLGAVDGAFAWPGFASRIVLELWEAQYSVSTEEEYLIRMTLNGEDVTKSLSCAAFNPEKSYCLLKDFAALVEQLIYPSTSWAEACSQPVEEDDSTSNTIKMMSVSAAASAMPVNL